MPSLILLLCALSIAAHRIDRNILTWLIDYKGKSTNSVVWDRRFMPLLDAAIPNVRYYLGMTKHGERAPLKDAVLETISGPPDDVEVHEGRYVILAACRAHSCPEKGFLWVDVDQGIVIGAIAHYFLNSEVWSREPMLLIFSRQMDADSLPARFRQDLEAWIKREELKIGKRRFVDASGKLANF